MAKYVHCGDSIECQKSALATRKISKPFAFKLDGFKNILYKYKTNINAIISIIEALDPKEYKIDPNSKLDIEDFLTADVIEIWTHIRFSDLDHLSNFSHVHGIQSKIIKDYTFAKIATPYRMHLEKLLTQ